jgi:hypothetical protein
VVGAGIDATFEQSVQMDGNANHRGQSEPPAKLQIKAILTYFPFDGEETKPYFIHDIDVFTDLPRLNDENSVESGDEETTSRRSPMLVFWANRWVPHDLVYSLPPLKDQGATTEEYLHRCSGLILFPRDTSITRNKMNLKISQNSVQSALGEKAATQQGCCLWEHRQNSANSVKKWLETCHLKHDKEIKFDSKRELATADYTKVYQWIKEGEGSKAKVKPSSAFTRFGTAEISMPDGPNLRFKVGEKVRVGQGNKGVAYGLIKDIVVEGDREPPYR